MAELRPDTLNEIRVLKRRDIDIEFTRTQTIIQGASPRDFRFYSDRVAEHESESVSAAKCAPGRRGTTRRATPTLSGRGERMRACGPLQREVRHSAPIPRTPRALLGTRPEPSRV